MRVPWLVRHDVMTPMDCDPLLGHRAGAEPQPEPKEVPHGRVELQAAVRLIPVQVKRDTQHHQLNQGESDQGIAPGRQLNQAVDD